MTPPTSVSTLLRDLIEDLTLFGPNKAPYPFGIGYHDQKWWVTVELNSPHATLDIETSAIDLHDALQIALRRIRREATIKGLAT